MAISPETCDKPRSSFASSSEEVIKILSSNDYKSWLGQTKHQLNTILNKYFQTRKSSTHRDCRMIRRKACLIADASINLEKEIQKQVDLLIIREDLVAVLTECK